MSSNLEFAGSGFDFQLDSQELFQIPAAALRLEQFAAEIAAQPPPPPPPPPRPVFRLTPAQLAKIERNCARLANLSDSTSAMF